MSAIQKSILDGINAHSNVRIISVTRNAPGDYTRKEMFDRTEPVGPAGVVKRLASSDVKISLDSIEAYPQPFKLPMSDEVWWVIPDGDATLEAHAKNVATEFIQLQTKADIELINRQIDKSRRTLDKIHDDRIDAGTDPSTLTHSEITVQVEGFISGGVEEYYRLMYGSQVGISAEWTETPDGDVSDKSTIVFTVAYPQDSFKAVADIFKDATVVGLSMIDLNVPVEGSAPEDIQQPQSGA